MNEFQQTIYRWCLDDNDLSILYKKNGAERYPDFNPSSSDDLVIWKTNYVCSKCACINNPNFD